MVPMTSPLLNVPPLTAGDVGGSMSLLIKVSNLTMACLLTKGYKVLTPEELLRASSSSK